jgi:hypothetical protein
MQGDFSLRIGTRSIYRSPWCVRTTDLVALPGSADDHEAVAKVSSKQSATVAVRGQVPCSQSWQGVESATVPLSTLGKILLSRRSQN